METARARDSAPAAKAANRVNGQSADHHWPRGAIVPSQHTSHTVMMRPFAYLTKIAPNTQSACFRLCQSHSGAGREGRGGGGGKAGTSRIVCPNGTQRVRDKSAAATAIQYLSRGARVSKSGAISVFRFTSTGNALLPAVFTRSRAWLVPMEMISIFMEKEKKTGALGKAPSINI